MTKRIINTTDEVSKWIAEHWQDDVHPSQMDAIAQVLSDWAADEGYGYGADCLDYLETITEDDIITLTDRFTDRLPEFSDEDMQAMYAEALAEQEWKDRRMEHHESY